MLLAHIREIDHAEQSVQEHLLEVALLARQYGETTGLGAHAELAGLLHDMGKFTEHFTNYLRNAILNDVVAKKKIDHSTAGAKYLYERFYGKDSTTDLVIETIGMAILSHHSGLQNFVQVDLGKSDFIRRVNNEELPYYGEVVRNFESMEDNRDRVERLIGASKEELITFILKAKPLGDPFVYLNLMQKLVFSCLIDADRTNTRCFEENEKDAPNDKADIFEQSYFTLMKTVAKWEESDNPMNSLRNDMSNSCDRFAEKASSTYQLTVPTGGGKTIASLRYALKHATIHKKSRIIYVVPYTTILEQNAQAVREKIKQPTAVLEHHANVIDDQSLDNGTDYYDSKYHKQLQLGRDNWDYPIIFTTMVQFLDAFYQKGTRKSRRLHNLTNAVIVFDEVQSVPFQHKKLFNASINFLQKVGNSSIILCTATQPAVGKEDPKVVLDENPEIVTELNEVVTAFKRVDFHNLLELEGWDANQIGNFVEELIQEKNSILIILNTKKAVRRLYDRLSDLSVSTVVHLSTSMCPAHRKEILSNIKSKLGNEKIICISTQLIEAGVDISFETVIRSLAGLDSIAQAAGRCNRNKEADTGDVYIIRAQDENLSKLPEIKIGGEVTENYILSETQYADHLLAPKTIERYFEYFDAQARREIRTAPKKFDHPLYYLLNGDVAKRRRPKTKSLGMFKTLERYFEAIESPTTAVLVPHQEEGKEIIAGLSERVDDFQAFNQLMKQAQQYSVNLYEHELQALSSEGLIESVYDGSIFCLNEKAYDEAFGVTIEGEAEMIDIQF